MKMERWENLETGDTIQTEAGRICFDPKWRKRPTWTAEKPTDPGYYWLRNYLRNHSSVLSVEHEERGFKPTHGPIIVHISRSIGLEPLDLTFTGNDCVLCLDDVGEAEWYGPIVPPLEGIDNFNVTAPRLANKNECLNSSEEVTLLGGPRDRHRTNIPRGHEVLDLRVVEEDVTAERDTVSPIHRYRRNPLKPNVFTYEGPLRG